MEVINDQSMPKDEQNEKMENLSHSQERKAESERKNPEVSIAVLFSFVGSLWILSIFIYF